MRIVSWRVFNPLMGEKTNPDVPLFGNGYAVNSETATGLKSLSGMIFPTYARPSVGRKIIPARAWMLLPLVSVTSNGVFEQVPTPGVVQLAGVAAVVLKSGRPRAAEKLPPRSARLGTVAIASVMPRVMRRCSSEKKK